MKKTVFITLTILVSNLITAQNPFLNSSFENWQTTASGTIVPFPADWWSSADYPVYKSNDACEGNFSVLLTDSSTNTSSIQQDGRIEQWTSYTGTVPTGISFCYKLDINNDDEAYVSTEIYDQNSSGYNSIQKTVFNQDKPLWTHQSLYFSTSPISSGAFAIKFKAVVFQKIFGTSVPVVFSKFLIDDVQLLFNTPTSLIENENKLSFVKISTKLSQQQVKLNDIGNFFNIEVLDLTGKAVLKESKFEVSNVLDLTNLTSGIYLIKFTSEHTQNIKKVIVD